MLHAINFHFVLFTRNFNIFSYPNVWLNSGCDKPKNRHRFWAYCSFVHTLYTV